MRKPAQITSLIILTFAVGSLPGQTPIKTVSPATIPFVGCPADGQLGPQPAPHGSSKQLPIPAEAASKLAWYEFSNEDGENTSTLAPRNWNCFVAIGSDGTFLFVTPEPLDATKVLDRKDWKGFTGPVVELSIILGDTSGRMEVAPIVAHVFPKYRSYVKSVIAEGFVTAKDFPFGPYPKDRLHYENDHVVDFTTPPNEIGLGISNWLLKGSLPITGIVLFDPSKDGDHVINKLALRLPADLRDLASIILNEVRSEWNSPQAQNK